MKPAVKAAYDNLQLIRVRLVKGEDYFKLKNEAKQHLDVINAEGAKIAKLHGQKFRKLTFSYIMR